MQNRTLNEELGRTSYPGRGIILGMSGDTGMVLPSASAME